MRLFRQLLLILFLTTGVANTAFAQQSAEDIKAMMVERDQQIKELLGPEGTEYSDEQRAEIKDIINGVIDFRSMAKFALEDTYDSISEELREEYVDLFTTIVRDQSMNKLDIYRASVTYDNIEVNGDSAVVKTTAELDDIRTPVDYELAFENGEWVIKDMSVDDVWTADSYNRQFQRIITRRGFDTLMESLRKRADRT